MRARGGEVKSYHRPGTQARLWKHVSPCPRHSKTRPTGVEVDMHVPPPPAHLSPSASQWWQHTVATYALEEHHLRLLQLACEAWDRAQAAREQLERDGLTTSGREGLKPHPAIAIERDSRLAVARLVRELD